MASSSRTRSSAGVLPLSGAFRRSISPSGRLTSSSAVGGGLSSSASAFASSAASAFASSSSRSSSFFHHRSASPTRVSIAGTSSPPSPSVRFSLDSRPTSPGRHLSVAADPIAGKRPSHAGGRKTCMCSPTTHPGSFRCSLHKAASAACLAGATSSPSNRLNARRSAMTNSLVRIGTVEGEWVKRALTALIRPSSHQQRRRAAFQPRPSRLSVMTKADDL